MGKHGKEPGKIRPGSGENSRIWGKHGQDLGKHRQDLGKHGLDLGRNKRVASLFISFKGVNIYSILIKLNIFLISYI